MTRVEAAGFYQLSKKALTGRNRAGWKKFLNFEPENTRFIAVCTGNEKPGYHTLIYVDITTRMVDPETEYRNIDSMFTKCDKLDGIFNIQKTEFDNFLDSLFGYKVDKKVKLERLPEFIKVTK